MKRNIFILYLIVVVSFNNSLFSQENLKIEPDSRLYEVLKSSYIENLLHNTPNQIFYFNYLLEHSYIITDFSTDKDFEYNELRKIDPETKKITNELITNSNLLNFNILKYKCSNEGKRTYYKIGNTGKMLIMLSNREVTKGFNDYRNKRISIK